MHLLGDFDETHGGSDPYMVCIWIVWYRGERESANRKELSLRGDGKQLLRYIGGLVTIRLILQESL